MMTQKRRLRLAALGAVCASLIAVACSAPAGTVEHGRLTALRVTGVGDEDLRPAFDPGVLHYAVRCADGTTLQVTAEAQDADAALTLLHDGRTATGAVQASITVDSDHDVAIEVRYRQAVRTYHVHCVPPEFPDIEVRKRTAAVTDGLLLMTPSVRRSGASFLAIVDNNGVARWVRTPNVRARNFRRYPDGRYSFSERDAEGVERTVIMDAGFNRIDTVTLAGDLLPEHTGGHDFLITERGTYLQMSYYPNTRDFSDFPCDGEPCSVDADTETDSVIQEVTPDGEVVFEWNSWDHVKMQDCTIHRFPNDYAHLNSLHELEGDIVAGLRGCAQVLRIEHATGAVVWQLGGSLPMRADRPPPATGAARYLPVVGDPLGEFCGQHHVTATAAGSLLMFDNGTHCLGARKAEPEVTRIVEYDISSGAEARFVRHYLLPAEHGVAASGGGVVALPGNGNWLVTWGNNGPTISVSEVDAAGNEVLRMNMERDGVRYGTARVYRVREADVGLRPNFPVPE